MQLNPSLAVYMQRATVDMLPIGPQRIFQGNSVSTSPKWPPISGLSRRAAMASLATTGLTIGFPSLLQAQNQSPKSQIGLLLGHSQRFEPGMVAEIARDLARRPYVAAPTDLPGPLSGLNYEQYIAIQALPPTQIWADGRGISVEPLHRGFVFTNAVDIFLVEDGVVRRIAYERSHYDYGRLEVPSDLGDIGFSGIRLFSTFGGDGPPVEFAIMQGATFFRALARGQNFGPVARALTLKPAETRGEEFPIFRAFWLERPSPGANAITIHAVVDSESTSGALRITFRPGEATITDVETTLFPRVLLEHVGIGGMGTSYLFGPNDRRDVDDARPSVYEADGLQILNGQGEWLWRPLQNPETLQISAFLDMSPKGFGLIQRERSYDAFQDDDQRFELRPSVWIEPLGEWGQGSVQLLEIPSNAEINDNILAYWRPKEPMSAGSEYAIAYRQYWCWTPPERPSLASVAMTRVGRGGGGRRRRFFVDFAGPILDDVVLADLKPLLSVNVGSVQMLKTWPYPERKVVRVTFELDPANENACEMRLLLEAAGKPVSETWLYRWTP